MICEKAENLLEKMRVASRLCIGFFLLSLFGLSLAVFGQDVRKDNKPKGERFIVTRNVNSTNAQNKFSIIKGTVFDLNKTGVSWAKIIFINENTHKELVVKTDDEGNFAIENLEVGSYLLQVNADGFMLFEEKGFKVNKNETVSIALTLIITDNDVGCPLPDKPKKP